ncbi:hypothetical protein PM082_021986 [Marasmius tenuissimus]|nr:hypothetical protein PM082_021986 [Marasmius tenuissimus]
MTLIPHERYFWELVVFQVEDKLFKVPKHGFENNPHPPFNEIFTLPQGVDGQEGSRRERRWTIRSSWVKFQRSILSDFWTSCTLSSR